MTVAMKPIYLDITSVSDAISLSPAVIHKLVRQEQFPKPRALSGRRVEWRTREVEAWAEARTVSEFLLPQTVGRAVARQAPMKPSRPRHIATA
ncbi:helix-turn-helix transcriptional regulator [Burkholderia sp. GS2Y]|uniref:AlpA family phage regulatory protein n=1 Tax=Burkholderia theae TaxID=3143496 RepID=A0ABU9WGN1_9BURK